MLDIVIGIIASVLAIAIGIFLFHYINKQHVGTEKMKQVADAIHEGARAFLKRQDITLLIFVAIMSVILVIAYYPQENWYLVVIAYITGSIASALAGIIGMEVAVRANVRSTNAAIKDPGKAFSIAFFGGSVMGMAVVGFALLGVILFYALTNDVTVTLGYSLGASSMALLARAGGGIYTKTADIAADLVGKVELNLPEDDPRNPAVIADNVGDNVGDVAGMGADLFDSYIASIVATMIVGYDYFTNGTLSMIYVTLPLLFAALGIFSSIVGLLFSQVGDKNNPGKILNRVTLVSTGVYIILMLVATLLLGINMAAFVATLAGLIAGVFIGLITDFFTSIDRKPTQKTAEAAKTGAATVILSGFSYAIQSIVPAIIGISAATLTAWHVSRIMGIPPLYGISIAAVGMLGIVGTIVSSDAYGPIADNAKGVAEQSGLGEDVIDVLDKLDAAGNTTKAITKGFAIGAAALTVLALLAAFSSLININAIDLLDAIFAPNIISGVLIGAIMPPLFAALVILAVTDNTEVMIEEIRRQVKEKPGIIEGTERPEYGRCVDIAEKGALKRLIAPAAITTAAPLVVGILLGPLALGGFLVGAIVTGLIFALLMDNAGATWDNAKKFIEEGHFGGKHSEPHKAAVTGDTVGDPFKDTAGPSLNTMITVMSLVASSFAGLVLLLSALIW